MRIDTAFDFRTDSKGKDPDSHSPTLRQYHQNLWSKKLPTGGMLVLDKQLNNTTNVGEFHFSSDFIIHTFSSWEFYQYIIKQIDPTIIQDLKNKKKTGSTENQLLTVREG